MGAEFWENRTSYQPDADAALRRLQAEVFHESGYDLAKILVEQIEGMADAIRWCEEEDDDDPDLCSHLLEVYRDGLKRLQQLASYGMPKDMGAKLKLLREIEAIGSDQARPGILALEGVSTERKEWKAWLLTAKEIEDAFGTSTPSLSEVPDGIDRLTDTIDRAMAVAFPVFEGDRPVYWYFIGYTWD